MPEIFDNEVLNASKFSLLEIENIEASNTITKTNGMNIMGVKF